MISLNVSGSFHMSLQNRALPNQSNLNDLLNQYTSLIWQ